MRQRARLDRALHEMPLVGDRMERGLQAAVAALREYFEPRAFFEDLGVRYTGPFDGHDVRGLESALRDAAEYDGPIVVHVMTQKGRGYAPAENDPIKRLHDMGVRRSRARTPPRSPRRSSRPARSIRSSSPSPRPCPTRPDYCRSASASPAG